MIKVTDLKRGSGEELRPGATVEVHFQVALSLDQLDTAEVLQSSWIDGRPLRLTLGTGAWRTELEQALVGVRVGTDRRLLVPAGTWPDVSKEIAVSLSIVSVVEGEATDATDLVRDEFEHLGCAIPRWDALGDDTGVGELRDALREQSRRAGSDRELVRLALTDRAISTLNQLLEEHQHLLSHDMEELGLDAEGNCEIDMAADDAAAVLDVLEEVRPA